MLGRSSREGSLAEVVEKVAFHWCLAEVLEKVVFYCRCLVEVVEKVPFHWSLAEEVHREGSMSLVLDRSIREGSVLHLCLAERSFR